MKPKSLISDNLFNKYWLKKSMIVNWTKQPSSALTKFNNWYTFGTLSVYDNCIKKNLNPRQKNKDAIITIDNNKKIKKYTYAETDQLVNDFIHFLKDNYKFIFFKKSKMMIHSSASIESAISMLACTKMGIHFSVIFEELEEKAILSRIKLFKPDIFFTKLNKINFDKKFNNNLIQNKNKILYFEDFTKNRNINPKKNNSKIVKSNDDFFTLFTSGSTGTPKGITHSYGGYLVYAKFTCQSQFGMKKKSIVLTASDAGWINGHTYSLFGPLSIGSTTILLQTPLLVLDKDILKKILSFNIDILYLPVTIIRMMKSLFKNSTLKKNKINTLGSMGEPLAPSVGKWYANFFGNKKKAIVNTYFQTETAGIICSPKFNQISKKVPHGSVGSPATKFIKLNKPTKKINEIKITTPWPGCMKSILNGKKEWQKYWDKNGSFKLFDLATKRNKNIYIHGRTDDVINIRGHRVGSEEIESAILKKKEVLECCAVGIDDPLEGTVLVIFIVSSKKINNIIEKEIFENFGSFAIPKKIYYLSELPKTRSGKVLRRLLRSILLNPKKKFYGDTTTLLNPNVIKQVQNLLSNDA
ncbi:acyl-CoA synthetase [Candidatus Pelagibacter sp.]|nr:acyl-CoA synthetase [Candidatus Pelagibacter sp.]